MSKYEMGMRGMLKLCEALGISTERPIQRIIIDMDCDGVVQVYTKELVEEEKFDALMNVLMKRTQKVKTEIKSYPIKELEGFKK